MKYIFIVLLLLFNIVFGSHITLYISNYGKNTIGCGKSIENACKSINYAVKRLKSSNISNIKLLVDSGNYYSEGSVDISNIHLSISSYNGLVVLNKSNENTAPHFTAQCSININSTSLHLENLSMDGCSVSYNHFASVFQYFTSYCQQDSVDVLFNNVQFECSSLSAPLLYYSVSGYNGNSGESYSYDSESSSSNSNSYSYDNDDTLLNYAGSSSNRDYSSNSTIFGSSSSDQSSQLYQNTFIDQQSFGNWPSQDSKIQASFVFSNCLFSNKNSDAYVGIYLFTSDGSKGTSLSVLNSTFSNISFDRSLVYTKSSLITFNNVNFKNTIHAIQPLFGLQYSRVIFNNVNIINSTFKPGSSLFIATVVLFNAHNFNLKIQTSTDTLFTLFKSTVSIENSYHLVSPILDNYQDYYKSNPYFLLLRSTLNLFSNSIVSRANSLLSLERSTVFINHNSITIQSNYLLKQNKLCSTQIDQYSLINADYTFEDYHQNNCYGIKTLLPSSKFDYYYIGFGFFSGVLVITLFFITIYAISSIRKCRRRRIKQNKLQLIN